MVKKYIKVNADFMPDGRIILKFMEWDDGNKYKVQKVFEAVRAASLRAGGTGIRYRCLREGQEWYLFLEDYEKADSVFGARFFVEGK